MPDRILILSYVYSPSVGGVERASLALARMLIHEGYQVTVATMTHVPPHSLPDREIDVVSRPSARRLLQLTREADAVIVNNPSLRLQWPLLLVHRPHMTVLHSVIGSGTLRLELIKAVKVLTLRRSAIVVAVSAALGRDTPVPTAVIPNTYDAGVFSAHVDQARREASVVFVGRLVHQKGADLVVDAVGMLRREGLPTELTVIGDGPERVALEAQARRLGIADHVRFTGSLEGDALRSTMAGACVMAVPSRGHEPFGITVLEGLAAGCAMVVTQVGGLPEALGGCGLLVPDGDAAALADAIRRLHQEPELRARLATGRAEHLDQHSPAAIGAVYDDALQSMLHPDRVPAVTR